MKNQDLKQSLITMLTAADIWQRFQLNVLEEPTDQPYKSFAAPQTEFSLTYILQCFSALKRVAVIRVSITIVLVLRYKDDCNLRVRWDAAENSAKSISLATLLLSKIKIA
jgi:hypothetical protein